MNRRRHRAALIVALMAVAVGLAFRGYVIARPTSTLTARYLADDYFYYLGARRTSPAAMAAASMAD